MPALSQGLQFPIFNSTSSVAVVYPNSATTAMIYYSEPAKGDGYYGSSAGLHTVMYTMTTNFIGTVTMQASLATQPGDGDWFPVENVTSSYNAMSNLQFTQTDYYNFTGNFVWVRGVVQIAAGTVESILYNH